MMWYRQDPFRLGGASQAHLKIDGLSAGYGAFLVLRDLKLEARPGLTVVLGPNGAGKTTLLKAINGLIPRQGAVLLNGEELPEKTHEIVQAGVALVAEGRQLFPQMSVTENLELGGWLVSAPRSGQSPARPPGGTSLLGAARRMLGSKAERARRIEQAFSDFPKLRERAHQLVGTMSGGEQQMVAVARAMMCAPRLLMLDEPSLGLAPKMVDELLGIARRIADAGTTVLMVEQNVKKALAVADRGYVLERGAIVASGPAKLLARSTVIREAYLGADKDPATGTTSAADAVQRRKAVAA
ncbi:ABC transporter ATP-binding protein [Hydrogenophaga sp. PML113]|uniref:ABC transporter ATP-binding protein n=1 Tax=Hydrogenophaga sp. PML113 TaxID=1899350 RepID=UPI000878D513|nr:ABC transporter ATP-binding protein [Hydrogenophaga sp. PML113]